MLKANTPEMQRVFDIFEEIAAIPRGSGNMKPISDYCADFARKNGLDYVVDEAQNVIIYKNASRGYEKAKPIILQGHLDMVCQCEEGKKIDFLTDAIQVYTDGDFIKAKGTTLGADNGIAVAYILSILEKRNIQHPKIEAVFTTDEEIGLIGASKLDMSLLKSERMINLDSEEEDTLTVSCAGGCNFNIKIPVKRNQLQGSKIEILLGGLKGGHSGVEINSGRVNANVLAGNFLSYMKKCTDFGIISIDGGTKSNAIPNLCKIVLAAKNSDKFLGIAKDYLATVKEEIMANEPDFSAKINVGQNTNYSIISKDLTEKFIYLLATAPNGVITMSEEVENLVETSLNFGVLETKDNEISICFSLRSNKASSMAALSERMQTLAKCIPCEAFFEGEYPAWEFKGNSLLQALYKECYKERFGSNPKVMAIHAGLECGIFASAKKDMDCISIGPNLFNVHTVNECMSVSSAERIYHLLLDILSKLG